MKSNHHNHQAKHREDRDRLINILLLLSWTTIGLILRFTNLALKPASSIEIATIGYSLGHGFAAIPLNEIVSPDTLLSPLHLDTSLGYSDVYTRLIQESTHPPFYFWLTHWWLKLWFADGDLVSLQMARSLSSIFGVLAIPAIFGLGWVACRSRLVAHFAALLMAISPYGIYLAQEARHYTLTVLWIIASVTCLVKSIQLIQQKNSPPRWLSLVWILINALGVATHYFMAIALGAEAIAIIVVWLFKHRQLGFNYWRGLFLAGCGTFASCLVWLPLARGISNNELTSWIQTSFALNDIWQPPLLLIAWIQTMVMLLPVERVATAIAIISVLTIEIIVIWAIPKLVKGWRWQINSSADNLAILTIASYLIGSVLLFLLIIYGLGRNLSLAARYHFVYFPALILLIAVALANCWRSQLNRRVVVVLLSMGLLGSLTVINNYGFNKSRQSDRLAALIQTTSSNPLIIMSHKTHSETRELISLAYSFHRLNVSNNPQSATPQFLLNPSLVDDIDPSLYNLDRAIARTKPLDLWAINLGIAEKSLNQIRCFRNTARDLPETGYRDRLYHCE
ncbi:hypothetical protein IQ255_06605 [Pleurocapsales cyanobacterium LEGE 10410]|nr:hypothetical protein [Pleurocapsales cyanobacterium LEGE 10410]